MAGSFQSTSGLNTSVLMTLYNRPRLVLQNTLSQLCKNDLRNTEVIIVDDGSTKNYDSLKAMLVGKEVNHKWIYLEPDPDCYSIDGYNNPVRAWNHALDNAEGDIIVTLASDCMIPPKAMNRARRPGKSIWMCGVVDMDSAMEYLGRKRIAPYGWFMSWNRTLYDVRWDEEYMKGIGYDDNDFTARLALAAKRIDVDLSITAYHQSHFPIAYSDGHKGHDINERYTWKKWGGVPWSHCDTDPLTVRGALRDGFHSLSVGLKSAETATVKEQHGIG